MAAMYTYNLSTHVFSDVKKAPIPSIKRDREKILLITICETDSDRTPEKGYLKSSMIEAIGFNVKKNRNECGTFDDG